MSKSFRVLLVLQTQLKPQELQDHLQEALHEKFEIVPRGAELFQRLECHGHHDGITTFVITFTKLVIAELFIHFDIDVVTGGRKERLYENTEASKFHKVFEAMVGSTTVMYAEGSDLKFRILKTVKDRPNTGNTFKWTEGNTNDCFMELVSEEVADLLFYRCLRRGDRETLFLFRIMAPSVTSVPFTSPTSDSPKAGEARLHLLTSRIQDVPNDIGKVGEARKISNRLQGEVPVAKTQVRAPVPVQPVELKPRVPVTQSQVPVPAHMGGSRTQTRLRVILRKKTYKLEDILVHVMNQVRPDLGYMRPVVQWKECGSFAIVRMGSELHADALMDALIEHTMKFFNDPPLRILRDKGYSRPGKCTRKEDADEDDRTIIITGFPARLDSFPAKAAIIELLGRAIGATATTITRFLMRGGVARVTLTSVTTVQDILDHPHQMVLCGSTLKVERLWNHDREFPWEDRLARSSSRDREYRERRRSRSWERLRRSRCSSWDRERRRNKIGEHRSRRNTSGWDVYPDRPHGSSRQDDSLFQQNHLNQQQRYWSFSPPERNIGRHEEGLYQHPGTNYAFDDYRDYGFQQKNYLRSQDGYRRVELQHQPGNDPVWIPEQHFYFP